MHPAFAVIQFGPFKSDYHNAVVDRGFQEALSDFLVAQLLPQVDEPFENTSGRLVATYDLPKHTGPASAVRDIYTLDVAFRRPIGSDKITADLAYSPKQQSFTPRFRGTPFRLLTAARQQAEIERTTKIRAVCAGILRCELVGSVVCPCCGAELHITTTPSLFDVSCPARCFSYNFHRDEQTGEFLHGHFFCAPLSG